MGIVLIQQEIRAPAGRQTLAGVWTSRALSERVQERRFGRLAAELTAVGGDAGVISLTRRAADDERLHERLCAEMALACGGADPRLAPEDGIRILWPEDMPLRDRVLYEVVASCCFMESLNASLLVAMHDAARVRGVKKIIHRILKDEVRHSRIGWAHLAAEQRRRDCGGLAAVLPKMLADTVREELFAPPPPAPDADELLSYGELPRQARLELFKKTMKEVVFPGFAALGIDTALGREWLAGKLDKMGA